jgi:hypothetical protein
MILRLSSSCPKMPSSPSFFLVTFRFQILVSVNYPRLQKIIPFIFLLVSKVMPLCKSGSILLLTF